MRRALEDDAHHKNSGWWLFPTPLKNDGVSNSWDYDIPNIWKNKIHVPNHQPVLLVPAI